jgi:hypothetical protein
MRETIFIARFVACSLQVLINPISPTVVRNQLIAHIDLRGYLPNWVQDIVIKKLLCVLLYQMQKAAAKINTDKENEHRQRIERDSEFYNGFLQPRIDRYFNDLATRQRGESAGSGPD